MNRSLQYGARRRLRELGALTATALAISLLPQIGQAAPPAVANSPEPGCTLAPPASRHDESTRCVSAKVSLDRDDFSLKTA